MENKQKRNDRFKRKKQIRLRFSLKKKKYLQTRSKLDKPEGQGVAIPQSRRSLEN